MKARGADANGATRIATRNTKHAADTMPNVRRAVAFVVLVAVLLLCPQGLFGRAE